MTKEESLKFLEETKRGIEKMSKEDFDKRLWELRIERPDFNKLLFEEFTKEM